MDAKFLDDLRKKGVLSIRVRHEETIQVGNYESIRPGIELGLVLDETHEASAESVYEELKNAVSKLFEDLALEQMRGVLDRRRALEITVDQKLAQGTAQYYKQLSVNNANDTN